MFDKQTLQGAWFAVSAYTIWGIAPIYFKAIVHVSPIEIVSHRVIWSVILLLGILVALGRIDTLRPAISSRPRILMTASLLTFNWTVFIYAIVSDNIVEASLGYFINPLVSILLGMVFLGERLRPLQWVAIALAALAIIYQVAWFGQVPWLGLALAFSFGFYGLVRKSLSLHPIGGLTIEVGMMVPVAAACLGWLAWQGDMQFAAINLQTDLLLMAGGIVTSLPLLLFAAAVTLLTLTAVGMFQYIAPSLSLLIAVALYDEPFGPDRLVTFCLIWLALAAYTTETVIHNRRVADHLKPDTKSSDRV